MILKCNDTKLLFQFQMEKYPLLEATMLYYYNGNWKTPKDRLIIFLHHFMINYRHRIFIDKETVS